MGTFSNRIIIVPTDLSDFSISAIRVATELASNRSFVRVIHVMPIIEPLQAEGAWVTMDETARYEQTKANLQEFLSQNQFGDLEHEIFIGNAGNEIANYASEQNAGLIVIPSHGRGMLQRLLLGSTTDRVVHLAHCPILVLRPDRPTGE